MELLYVYSAIKIFIKKKEIKMCLEEEIKKLRSMIQHEGIKNALQHDAIINFTHNIHDNTEMNNATKRKHGKY